MPDIARLEIAIAGGQDENYLSTFHCQLPKNIAEIRDVQAGFSIDSIALLATNDAQAYGHLLTQSLFASPEANQAFLQARAAAKYLQLPLMVRLSIDANVSELHNLRWETLLDPKDQQPLCTDEDVFFSRFLSSAYFHPYIPEQRDRLRAVAVISNPKNLVPNTLSLCPLDITAEIARAKDYLAETDLTLLGSNGSATLDGLVSAMDDCDILYLVCHGGFIRGLPHLWLEKANGTAEVIDMHTFVTQVRQVKHLPFLAILVSCQSAGIESKMDQSVLMALGPQLMERGVPAVLAMHGNVSFPTIDRFLPSFFRELWRDGQIDRAVTAARRAIQRTKPDWWMPVLYSRLSDNRLFLLPEKAGKIPHADFVPETVFIPGGKFWMGRDPGPGIPDWETPCDQVDLPAYWIGKYPVTNRQFAEFVRDKNLTIAKKGWEANKPLPEYCEQPVSGVTWCQAMEYCEWLSAKTGRTYSLPNESQWEKAARGPRDGVHSLDNGTQENFIDTRTSSLPPVSRFPAQSPYGCCDIGKHREWTASLWGKMPGKPEFRYPLPKGSDAKDAHKMMRRVVRGGSASSTELTCTHRSGYDPDDPGSPGNPFCFRVIMIIKG